MCFLYSIRTFVFTHSFTFESPTLNSNLRRYLSSKLADLCKNIINLTSLNTLPRCKKQKVWLWHFRLAHRSKTRFGKRDEMRICLDDKLTIFSNPVKVGHSGMKYLLNMHWQFSHDNFLIFQSYPDWIFKKYLSKSQMLKPAHNNSEDFSSKVLLNKCRFSFNKEASKS